jgi:hypothetical protein
VTTRKILSEMSISKLEVLNKFRMEAVGKEYGINPFDFLCCGTTSTKTHGNQTFFCSQLIAEVFKEL